MKIVPYLYFNGNCEEAFNFYHNILGGELSEIMRYKDQSSQELPSELGERILHAELAIGDILLYFSDTPDKEMYNPGDNIQLNLNLDSLEEINKVYKAFEIGANITMPLQDTFWNAVYGTLIDKFGVSWSFNYMKG